MANMNPQEILNLITQGQQGNFAANKAVTAGQPHPLSNEASPDPLFDKAALLWSELTGEEPATDGAIMAVNALAEAMSRKNPNYDAGRQMSPGPSRGAAPDPMEAIMGQLLSDEMAQ